MTLAEWKFVQAVLTDLCYGYVVPVNDKKMALYFIQREINLKQLGATDGSTSTAKT